MMGPRGPTFDETDFDYCAEQGVRVVTMEEVYEKGLTVVFEAMDQVRNNECYVTIDIDAVDPAFAPGTTLPTPGGFSSADIIRLVRHLKGFKAVGFDIVELQPSFDHGGITAMLVGMLAYEFLCTR